MAYPKLVVLNQKKELIGIQRVNDLKPLPPLPSPTIYRDDNGWWSDGGA